MAKRRFIDRLLGRGKLEANKVSWIRQFVSGSMYRLSDLDHSSDLADIKTQIDTMRALARDSQISTALSYYATDATTVNTANQIIWATPKDKKDKNIADVINDLFRRWKINDYARDHLLELATIGNLYIPTTGMYKELSNRVTREGVALDNNTIVDPEFDIVPSTKVPPEDIVHLWFQGQPQGYIIQPDDNVTPSVIFPESACIHFSLGGLLGDYSIQVINREDNQPIKYDIQFAQPLMEKAVQPTQTLGLLENALVLSSLIRVVKFINVDCSGSTEDEEIRSALQDVKDAIEQQLSLNTDTGDVQSFVNPQSPNNLVYMPKVNGQDPISITDLNMSDATDSDSKLLDYYQDKKLSVLGVPKEAMNFSSNEGLGGAGSVLSQRSNIYANALQRLETAYMNGWTSAINTYFIMRGLSELVDTFDLHMNPIITSQSTIQFEKRDAALGQAAQLVDMMKSLNVTDNKDVLNALKEILSEVFPQMGNDVNSWNIDMTEAGGSSDEF